MMKVKHTDSNYYTNGALMGALIGALMGAPFYTHVSLMVPVNITISWKGGGVL